MNEADLWVGVLVLCILAPWWIGLPLLILFAGLGYAALADG